MRRIQIGTTNLFPELKSERLNRLLVAGGHWLVLLFFLIGLLGIVLTSAFVLVEPLATSVIARDLYRIVVGTSIVLSLLLLTPLGTKLRKRIGIPYIGADTRPWKFLALTLQLGLILLVIRAFQIESAAFVQTVFVYAIFGFFVQHALPPSYRLRFFVILSIVTIFTVLGWENGAWVIGLGLLMIGICHLPLKIGWRIGLLLLAAAFFVLGRVALVPVPWSIGVWPILASLLMFRLIVYLYELHHNPLRPTPSQTLAYFFMLPNVVFPLFPVVDFNTMRRTYLNEDEYAIYQRGIRWILRGVVFLLLYRISYYFLVLEPSSVQNAGDLARFIVSNYLLLLRLIGQFDLIIGILCLFGFHLPEANLFNFFAVSFTDFWRRNNPYWREFMMKMVYYPSFFRMRGQGLIPGMLLATGVVFFVTWFMHGYQWFWILGTFPLTVPDILFWFIFALLLSANLVLEAKRGRVRAVPGARRRMSDHMRHVVFGLAMFIGIAVLWSLWTSSSLDEWLSLWNASTVIPAFNPQALALAVGVAVLFLGVYLGIGLFGQSSPQRQTGVSFYRGALLSGVLILGLYLASTFQGTFPFYPPIGAMIRDLKINRLNAADSNLKVRGYYENVMFTRANSELWQVYMNRPMQQLDMINNSSVWRSVNGFLGTELWPSNDVILKAARVRTNHWGMRDREYALEKPPGTYRIALFGSSYVMGEGVGDSETFENLLEDRFNLEHPASRFDLYEILNFAVSKYSAAQDLTVLEQKALGFNPDAMVLVGHSREGSFLVDHLVRQAREGRAIPYPYLEQIVQSAGITRETSAEESRRLLAPYQRQLLEWTFEQIIAVSRAHKVRPIWVFLETPGRAAQGAEVLELVQMAQAAGFTVINLEDVYNGHDTASLVLGPDDDHPNVKGHRLIAERLYAELLKPEIASALFSE